MHLAAKVIPKLSVRLHLLFRPLYVFLCPLVPDILLFLTETLPFFKNFLKFLTIKTSWIGFFLVTPSVFKFLNLLDYEKCLSWLSGEWRFLWDWFCFRFGKGLELCVGRQGQREWDDCVHQSSKRVVLLVLAVLLVGYPLWVCLRFIFLHMIVLEPQHLTRKSCKLIVLASGDVIKKHQWVCHLWVCDYNVLSWELRFLVWLNMSVCLKTLTVQVSWRHWRSLRMAVSERIGFCGVDVAPKQSIRCKRWWLIAKWTPVRRWYRRSKRKCSATIRMLRLRRLALSKTI